MKQGIELTALISKNDCYLLVRISSCVQVRPRYLCFFPEDVGTILQNAYIENSDDEGTYLTKAVNIMRREVQNSTVNFEGQFDENWQATFVSKALVILVSVIMNGSQLTLENQHDNVCSQQAFLSAALLLAFNTYKRCRKLKIFTKHKIQHFKEKKDSKFYKTQHRGLLIHSQTQQSNLVSDLYNLGPSISYERVLVIENLKQIQSLNSLSLIELFVLSNYVKIFSQQLRMINIYRP